MVLDDDEITQSRAQEQGLKSAAKREAIAKKRLLKLFSEKALQAKRAGDSRAFSEQLRLAGVKEDSPERKRAWKLFYSE